jgi:hypothetical protein
MKNMLDCIQKLSPKDGDIITITISEEMKDTANIAKKISDAVKPLYDFYGGKVHFLILPEEITVDKISERDLNNLGYYRRVEEISVSILTYLGCPFSHPDEKVRLERRKAVSRFAAKLIRRGEIVFSPISLMDSVLENAEPED